VTCGCPLCMIEDAFIATRWRPLLPGCCFPAQSVPKARPLCALHPSGALMHRNDIGRLALREGDHVRLVTVANDGADRQLGGLTVIAYDIPEGCCGGYYPECNVLVPL